MNNLFIFLSLCPTDVSERFFSAHEIYAYLMNGYKQQYKNWFEVFQFKWSKYKSPFIILCIVYFRWFFSFSFRFYRISIEHFLLNAWIVALLPCRMPTNVIKECLVFIALTRYHHCAIIIHVATREWLFFSSYRQTIVCIKIHTDFSIKHFYVNTKSGLLRYESEKIS